MSKIVKSFSKKTKEEIEGGGVTNYVSWEWLKEYLAIAAGVKSNEQVDGIVVDENGIKIRIGQKK